MCMDDGVTTKLTTVFNKDRWWVKFEAIQEAAHKSMMTPRY
jgi:hypothetical protein